MAVDEAQLMAVDEAFVARDSGPSGRRRQAEVGRYRAELAELEEELKGATKAAEGYKQDQC